MESPRDIQSQIANRLSEDGLNPVSSDLEKLLFLWKLYLQLQEELQKCHQNEAKMKEAQAVEMQEVESYVEHIRQLSDEREALIQELENENEVLKLKIAQADQTSSATEAEQITEMLREQGLAEISKSSPSEQIAYLIVERGRLIKDMNTLSEKTESGPSSNIDHILEQERAEFEREMNQQRENAKLLREQLKQEHEEEVSALIEENGKLEEDLQNAEMRLSQLKAELSRYTDEADLEDSGNGRSLRTRSSKDSLSEERNQLNLEREEIEREMAEIENDRSDFKKEKDAFYKEKMEFEKEKSTLQKEMDKLKRLREDLEIETDELEIEKEELQKEMKQLQAELEDLKNRKVNLDQDLENSVREKAMDETDEKDGTRIKSLRSGSPSRPSNDIMLRKVIEEKTKIEGELIQVKAQMKAIQKDKDSHTEEVNSLKKDLEKSLLQNQQLQMKNKNLNSDMESLEAQLDEVELSLETVSKEKETLASKVQSLTSELKTLRADSAKSSTLQDIVDILSNDKRELTEKLESIKRNYEQTSEEKVRLADQNEKLTLEEQELTNQLLSLRQELSQVSRDKELLHNEEQKLLAVTLKQGEVEQLLKRNMEELTKTNDKLVRQTEMLTKENKDLINRLDKAKDEIEAVKIQSLEMEKLKLVISHLKEQNEQAQHLLSSSQSELNKSKDRESMLISNQQLLQKGHSETENRLSHDVEDLRVKLEMTLQELSKLKKNCEELEVEKKNLAGALSQADNENSGLEHQLLEKQRQVDQMRVSLSQSEQELKKKDQLIEELKHQLDAEQKKNEELEKLMEVLKVSLISKVDKEELAASREELHKETQLCTELKIRGQELELRVRELEMNTNSAEKMLHNERQLRLGLERHIEEIKVASKKHEALEDRLKEAMQQEITVHQDLEKSKQDVKLLTCELEKERKLSTDLAKKISTLETMSQEMASSTLKAALDELDRERKAGAQAELRAQELQQMMEEQSQTHEDVRHKLHSKIILLEERVRDLESEVCTSQNDYRSLQDRFNLAVKELQMNKTEVMEMEFVDGIHCDPPASSSQIELERSLTSATSKLNDALNEVNLTRTKLAQTEEELEAARRENESLGNNSSLLKQSLEWSNKHAEKCETELRSLRNELAETQGSLEFAQIQLRTRQTRVDLLAKENEELQEEVQALKDSHTNNSASLPNFEKERQSLMDRISILEHLSRRLELDNRETAKKLTEATAQSRSLESQLDREKLTSSGKTNHDRRYTDQLEHDLDTANKHVRQLREDLHQQQVKVFNVESNSLGLSAKYESMIAHLEENIQVLKQKHQQELGALQEQLDALGAEVSRSQQRNQDLEEEQRTLTTEVSILRSKADKLEMHLQAEINVKLELEKRNSLIDIELSKAYDQIRRLLDRNAELESMKHSYELDITMQRSSIQQAESSILQKEATYEASTKAIVARAEAAEKKARELQRDLEEVTHKMLYIEGQLSSAERHRGYVDGGKERIEAVRKQLEGEKLQRTLLDQTVAELKHQVTYFKHREMKLNLENKELHQIILDLESHLNGLHDNYTQEFMPSQPSTDHSLLDQITRLQLEVKELQCELTNVSERRDVDMKRYEERKLRTKSKLIKARQFYTNEKGKYMSQMQKMDDDLKLTKAILHKELEWRDRMDESYKQLLREKRELITQLSEMEETVKDNSRALSMAQARLEYLEEENSNFQDLLSSVSQESNHLRQLLKEKNSSTPDLSEEMYGSGTVRDLGWGSDEHFDHTWTVEPPAHFKRTDLNGHQEKAEVGGSDLQFLPPTSISFKRFSQTNGIQLMEGDDVSFLDKNEFDA